MSNEVGVEVDAGERFVGNAVRDVVKESSLSGLLLKGDVVEGRRLFNETCDVLGHKLGREKAGGLKDLVAAVVSDGVAKDGFEFDSKEVFDNESNIMVSSGLMDRRDVMVLRGMVVGGVVGKVGGEGQVNLDQAKRQALNLGFNERLVEGLARMVKAAMV